MELKFSKRKSDFPDTDSMLLLIVSLPCTTQKLETLLSPSFEYRLQWDTMLDGIQVLREWPEEEVFLIRHLVHKVFTISPRDSIDVVKIVRGKDELVFGATSTLHADYPPCKDYVRTHQYLGGYFIRPCDSKEKHLKFHMLFHADLNMAGPRFISTVASKFKPRLMAQKAENLLKAIDKFDIDEGDQGIGEKSPCAKNIKNKK